MREIKFRAWDNKYKFMVGLNGVQDLFSIRSDGTPSNENYILMQFTGLRDKNGREIYEGDVVLKRFQTRPYSMSAKEKKFPCIVDYYEDGFRYRRIDRGKEYLSYRCWNGTWQDTEVIGNVYENPDGTEAVDGT
jgi:uncharacterized phage protein (TIGR01671 family)